MRTQNIRTLSLILSSIFYLLVGAAGFDALESEGESSRKKGAGAEAERAEEKYEDDFNEICGPSDRAASRWEAVEVRRLFLRCHHRYHYNWQVYNVVA